MGFYIQIFLTSIIMTRSNNGGILQLQQYVLTTNPIQFNYYFMTLFMIHTIYSKQELKVKTNHQLYISRIRYIFLYVFSQASLPA
jgi:hypothetical protein